MDRFYRFTVTVPSGTAIAAPAAVALPLEDATLKRIEITIPDGHNGLTGIRILWANQQIIPWGNNSWIVANGRIILISFDDEMTVTGLVAQGYNTDVFDHSFYIDVTISDLPSAQQMANNAAAGAVILPASTVTVADPLGPAALLASLPADVLAGMGAM